MSGVYYRRGRIIFGPRTFRIWAGRKQTMMRSSRRWLGVAIAAIFLCNAPAPAGATGYVNAGLHLIAMLPLPAHAGGLGSVNEVLNKIYTSGGGPPGSETVDVIDGVT